MTEEEIKEIRDFEKIRLKYYLIIQIVGTSLTLITGYTSKLDDTTETGFWLMFLMVVFFNLTCAHNIYMGMDYLSRKMFKNEWSGELTDEETKDILYDFSFRYDAIFVFFAICHASMFIGTFIYDAMGGL